MHCETRRCVMHSSGCVLRKNSRWQMSGQVCNMSDHDVFVAVAVVVAKAPYYVPLFFLLLFFCFVLFFHPSNIKNAFMFVSPL